MRRSIGGIVAAFLGLVPFVPGLEAGSPKHASAQLAHARYVALGYDLGDRFMSEQVAISDTDRVTPDDRATLAAIRDLVESWDRYVIVHRADQAELLIAVRKGRRVSLGGGFPTGPATPGQVGRSPGSSLRGEFSSASDMLSIYESRGGQPGTLLWREMQANGLSGSPPRLFQSFKADVERAAKKP